MMLAAGFYFLKKDIGTINIPGSQPLNQTNVAAGGTVASLPGFTVPAGFSLSIFAKNIHGARVMAIDSNGDIWVTETGEGKVGIVDGHTGTVDTVLTGLDNPHGLVFDPANSPCGGTAYLAEETKISEINISCNSNPGQPRISLGKKIADLPKGGRHFTRTLLFGADGRLYVSIGSDCDACNEKDPRLAAIYSMNKDGSDFKKVATGLRNSVFMALNPVDGKIYATEMGRDTLGDNIPPDEINIIEQDKNYGWPNCYGQNIHDTKFDHNTYIRNPCMAPFETPSFIDLQAHSAPLGLAFIPADSPWGEEYRYNMLVAYHGSWNRSTPTGYKIVRIKLNAKGEYLGTEDFITGWLKDGKKSGRPVDIKVLPGGTAYISDDTSGVIYRLSKN